MLHDPTHDDASKACCGQTADTTAEVAAPPPGTGRSFRVNGLDCAEEVAILNKVVGPEVGGSEHLAFDVINGRMTILESAKPLGDDKIIKIVGSTGMSAKIWDAETAGEDQAAHFARQRLFTGLSGGFWAAGFLFHIVETGAGARCDSFPVMARRRCRSLRSACSCWRSSSVPGSSHPRPGPRCAAFHRT